MRVVVVSCFLFALMQGCLGQMRHDKAIHEAAELGKLDEVKSLIETKKVDVNRLGFSDATPLMKAVRGLPGIYSKQPPVQDRLEVVKYLIEKGADVKALDADSNTPLHYATFSREPENSIIVKYLVEKGAKVKAKNNLKATPLLSAARNGQLESVKHLIEKGANVKSKNDKNVTPLLGAAAQGHLEIVKYLIENGAEIDALDRWNNSAVMEAAKANSLDTVKYLVEKGAVVLNENSHRLLKSSVANNNLEMLKYFIGLGVPATGPVGEVTPLHIAAESYVDTLEPIKLLIEKGADVNAVDFLKLTPAHYAAKKGKWKVVKYLDENTKANMFLEDSDKKTPFSYLSEEIGGLADGRQFLQSWYRKHNLQL